MHLKNIPKHNPINHAYRSLIEGGPCALSFTLYCEYPQYTRTGDCPFGHPHSSQTRSGIISLMPFSPCRLNDAYIIHGWPRDQDFFHWRSGFLFNGDTTLIRPPRCHHTQRAASQYSWTKHNMLSKNKNHISTHTLPIR